MSIALVGCSNSNDSDQSSNEKSSSKVRRKTDVATEYTKEDEYKELEKAKDLKQKPVLNEIDALITEKGFTNKTDCKAGKTIKISG